MKKSFQRVTAALNLFQGKQSLTIFLLAAIFALTACGDDDSSSPKGTGLPAEVADKAELETYECSMDVIGEKVYVTELEENYECDGEKWFKSYDQTKPSSTESSSGKNPDGSSDSKTADKEGSSGNDKGEAKSSSSAMSSSSRPTEILEPEITVNETCTEVGACDAMVKTDVSTWHFVRKDDFGDDAEYTYTADGKDLIVTIKNADGTTNSKTYSMYNMESEAGVEMAFNAAKSTCKNGGGNDNKIKSCVKDTVKALPECNASREGAIGKKDSVSYVICKNGSWKEFDMDTYGKTCTNAEVGTRTNGFVTETNKYYCTSNGWVLMGDWSWDLPKEAYLNPEIEYGTMTDERDGQVYRTTTIGDQVWMAENLNYADSSRKGTWCYTCDVAGRLYTWAAATTACPGGWHLPTYAEWNVLFTAVDGYSTAGKVLKSQTGWNDNGNGTDAFGFSALPAGIMDCDHGIRSPGYNAFFWSSTEYSALNVYGMTLFNGSGGTTLTYSDKDNGYSVRCVKDSD